MSASATAQQNIFWKDRIHKDLHFISPRRHLKPISNSFYAKWDDAIECASTLTTRRNSAIHTDQRARKSDTSHHRRREHEHMTADLPGMPAAGVRSVEDEEAHVPKAPAEPPIKLAPRHESRWCARPPPDRPATAAAVSMRATVGGRDLTCRSVRVPAPSAESAVADMATTNIMWRQGFRNPTAVVVAGSSDAEKKSALSSEQASSDKGPPQPSRGMVTGLVRDFAGRFISPGRRMRPTKDHQGRLVYSMDSNGPFSMTW